MSKREQSSSDKEEEEDPYASLRRKGYSPDVLLRAYEKYGYMKDTTNKNDTKDDETIVTTNASANVATGSTTTTTAATPVTSTQGRVIVITFAGRQDRMSILCKLMDKLAQLKWIHEYHLWNFTRNDKDERWLKDWASSRSSYVRIFHPANKKTWGECYRHYVGLAASFKEDVFLKLDDDIVHLSLDTFSSFMQFRRANPQYWIVSANVINNEMCAYYQQEKGLLPKHPRLGKLAHSPNGFGPLWSSGDWPHYVHDLFLKNENEPTKFRYEGIVEQPIGERISINAIAWMGRDWELMNALGSRTDDDELYMSVKLPQTYQRPNAIFGSFVAAHLSFGKQEERRYHFVEKIPLLLQRYNILADRSISLIDSLSNVNANVSEKNKPHAEIKVETKQEASDAPIVVQLWLKTAVHTHWLKRLVTEMLRESSNSAQNTHNTHNTQNTQNTQTQKRPILWSTQPVHRSMLPHVLITDQMHHLVQMQNDMAKEPMWMRPVAIFLQTDVYVSVSTMKQYFSMIKTQKCFPISLWIDTQCNPRLRFPAIPFLFVPPFLAYAIQQTQIVSHGSNNEAFIEKRTIPEWWTEAQASTTDTLWNVYSIGGPPSFLDGASVTTKQTSFVPNNNKWSHPFFSELNMRTWHEIQKDPPRWPELWTEWLAPKLKDQVSSARHDAWIQSSIQRAIQWSRCGEQYVELAKQELAPLSAHLVADNTKRSDKILFDYAALQAIMGMENNNTPIKSVKSGIESTLVMSDHLRLCSENTHLQTHVHKSAVIPFWTLLRTEEESRIHQDQLGWKIASKEYLPNTYVLAMTFEKNTQEVQDFVTQHTERLKKSDLAAREDMFTHTSLWEIYIGDNLLTPICVQSAVVKWNLPLLTSVMSILCSHLVPGVDHGCHIVWFEPHSEFASIYPGSAIDTLRFEKIADLVAREPKSLRVPMGAQSWLYSPPMTTTKTMYPYILTPSGARHFMERWKNSTTNATTLYEWMQIHQKPEYSFVCRIPHLLLALS